MTVHELAELVRQTREAQRTYFRTRTTEALETSKRMEKALDLKVAEALSLSLFDEMPNTLTEEEVRTALQNTPLLDAHDYQLLTRITNSDPDEGLEWMPYYKLAGGLTWRALGMFDVTLVTLLHEASPFLNKRLIAHHRQLLGAARRLAIIANRVCGLGPNPTPEAIARVDAANATLFQEFP